VAQAVVGVVLHTLQMEVAVVVMLLPGALKVAVLV
jgi:hypothetical protein